MVTIDFIARCALSVDTAVSRAFLRALGIPARTPAPPAGTVVSVEAYEGMAWCMRNAASPMDGRF